MYTPVYSSIILIVVILLLLILLTTVVVLIVVIIDGLEYERGRCQFPIYLIANYLPSLWKQSIDIYIPRQARSRKPRPGELYNFCTSAPTCALAGNICSEIYRTTTTGASDGKLVVVHVWWSGIVSHRSSSYTRYVCTRLKTMQVVGHRPITSTRFMTK